MHDDSAPDWVDPLLQTVEEKTAEQQPIDAAVLRRIGLSHPQIGRWFGKRFDFSFDAYCRMRRLANEIGSTHYCSKPKSQPVVGRKPLFRHLLASKQINTTQPSKSSILLVNRILTPLGPMIAIVNESGICLLEFVDRRMLETNITRVAKRFGVQFRTGVNAHLTQLANELRMYFAGELTEFKVPLADEGTQFQTLVWQRLKQIQHGQTTTYSKIAADIDKPTAIRAVGRANGDNRLAILIPCHRLVGTDGALTGYGGGLDRKQWLIDHESKHPA